MRREALPIDEHLESILGTLRESSTLILEAPPGTGKTTRVAPALMDLPELVGRIALIQPRRIAARATAARIAYERRVELGSQVGYQVRFDSCCRSDTRLISMTPGILLRSLQSDPLLESISVVVMDEFHERSLEVDLLLGMIRQLQRELRPDLRLVVMSATLDGQEEIGHFLGSPSAIQITAPAYPVTIRYSRTLGSGSGRPVSQSRRIIDSATQATEEAISACEGDILVFLPGVGEIMQVQRTLQNSCDRRGIDLLTLYGDLPAGEQDRILTPGNRRRVILSTNIAETSLTIDGIRVVVDSGWARVMRIDPSNGLDCLRLEPISQASATQRCGRAGRTAPGICYRLWDQTADRGRPLALEPEVLRTDLASAVLQLLCWNERPEAFAWLTVPSENALRQARRTLEWIGAIQGDQITPMGRQLLRFPTHPRLARLMIESHRLGIPATGAKAAALLSERDLFMREQSLPGRKPIRRSDATTTNKIWDCDLTHRIQVWDQFLLDGNDETALGVINRSAARHLSQVSQQFLHMLKSELGSREEDPLTDQLQRCLLTAFPDRLAKRRGPTGAKALMVGGKGVELDTKSGVRDALFLCLDVSGGGVDAVVRMASTIDSRWLKPEELRIRDERFFHPSQQAVVMRRRTYWIDLLLDEQPAETPLDLETARLLAREAAKQFDRLLPSKDKTLHSLLERMKWLSGYMPQDKLPQWDIDSLTESLTDWCVGMRSFADLKQISWKAFLESLLTVDQKQLLSQQAPESITLPSGRTVLLQYETGRPPVLAAKIQDMFGWKTTPKLARGQVPLTLHLLAPNQRVQQITDDLESFWKNTYPVVRKELRGRYPKHSWPEDPFNP
jgi:ATP-dependent helicase HrpB